MQPLYEMPFKNSGKVISSELAIMTSTRDCMKGKPGAKILTHNQDGDARHAIKYFNLTRDKMPIKRKAGLCFASTLRWHKEALHHPDRLTDRNIFFSDQGVKQQSIIGEIRFDQSIYGIMNVENNSKGLAKKKVYEINGLNLEENLADKCKMVPKAAAAKAWQIIMNNGDSDRSHYVWSSSDPAHAMGLTKDGNILYYLEPNTGLWIAHNEQDFVTKVHHCLFKSQDDYEVRKALIKETKVSVAAKKLELNIANELFPDDREFLATAENTLAAEVKLLDKAKNKKLFFCKWTLHKVMRA